MASLSHAAGDDLPTISDLIVAQATQRPTAVFLRAPDRPDLTYAALHVLMVETERCLRAAGLPRAARIAVALPDGPELLAATLILEAVAIAAPFSVEAPLPELAHSLRQLRADAIIVAAPVDAVPRAAAQQAGCRVIALASDPRQPAGTFTLRVDERGSAPAPAAPALLTDMALIMPTSGTTGTPKFVPITHQNLTYGATLRCAWFAFSPADRCLALSPILHVSQIAHVISVLRSGSSMFYPGPVDHDRLAGWLDAYRPTWLTTVPTILRAMLDRGPRYATVLARCPLRFIRSTGAMLPPPLRREIERVFAAPLINGYGLTETTPLVSTGHLIPVPGKDDSVGQPIGCEVRILDETLQPLPSPLVGEIAVRGPNVVTGYLDEPAGASPTFLPDGWLRTGDLGYFDADGFLYLTGRIKEMINRGGQKVAPSEVEAVLLAHPTVAEVAVFALPHPRLGEEVAAAVRPHPGGQIDERELRAWVAARLAWPKVPNQIVAVDRFPLSPTGKIRRLRLARDLGLVASETVDAGVTHRYLAPATPVEQFVADVWATVLGVPRVGVLDDLPRLGGSSLDAARIVARLNTELGLDLPVVDLLAGATIGEVATRIERAFADDDAAVAPA